MGKQGKRIAIVNGDDTNPLILSVVESSTTPGVFGIVMLNPDGSKIATSITLDYKDNVVVATTANITLSGEQTIDGVLTSSSRVLVKNQSTAANNGIYVSAAGAWTRATDANTSAKVTSGMITYISQGTTQGGSAWVLTTPDPITLGSTSLSFSQFPTNSATSTIVDDTTTNATMYLTWVTAGSGNLPMKVSTTKVSFNPSTGKLTVAGDISSGGNINGVNLLSGYSTTATATTTTTLSASSNKIQYFTGVTTQTVTLPVASTLSLGQEYIIVNNSTGAVTVNSSGSNAVLILAGGTSAIIRCILTSGTSAASWDATYFATSYTSGTKMTAPAASDTLMGIAATQTVTNKRNQPRSYTVADTATLTPEIDTYSEFSITALAQALTIANHSTSTPVNGEKIFIEITPDATPRAISFGTNYVAKAGVALPTTTTASKKTSMLFRWSAALSKYNLLAVGTEA